MRFFPFAIFILYYAYAIIRYHGGADVPLSDWMFIMNKAFAWTAFTWIGLSVLPQHVLNTIKTDRRNLGVQGFSLGITHAIVTFCLLSPYYYGKLYDGSELSTIGWVALSIGVVTILIYLFPLVGALKDLPNTHSVFRFGRIGFFFSTLHPAIIGFSGWFQPGTWPYYMPPITLLAFLTGIGFFALRALLRKV
jgi:hypothetical protein